MGFDPGFGRPTCLATLKSSDRTKQSVDDVDDIYIYIHTQIRNHKYEEPVDLMFRLYFYLIFLKLNVFKICVGGIEKIRKINTVPWLLEIIS